MKPAAYPAPVMGRYTIVPPRTDDRPFFMETGLKRRPRPLHPLPHAGQNGPLRTPASALQTPFLRVMKGKFLPSPHDQKGDASCHTKTP